MPIYRFQTRISHRAAAASTVLELPHDLAAIRHARRDIFCDPTVECITVCDAGRHVVHILRGGMSRAVWTAHDAIARSKGRLATSLRMLREHIPHQALATARLEDG